MKEEDLPPTHVPDALAQLRDKALAGSISPEDVLRAIEGRAPEQASPAPHPAPPTTFAGRYDLREELGRGGMGVVYRAHDRVLGRDVALKLLHAVGWSSQVDRERFARESRAAAALDHPHIVRVFDVGVQPSPREGEGALPFYTMELLQGQDLARAIGTALLTPRDAIEIARQIATALAHAHACGILHRDVKPQNVFLRQGTASTDATPETRTAGTGVHALLVDFGLAKFAEEALRTEDTATIRVVTASGQLLGTPVYMAPEQIRRAHEVDARADVYSLGATLYHALTGRPPFAAPTLSELLQSVQHDDPAPPRKVNARLDRDAQTICLKCLAKEPERRYAGAADLAEDCRRYLAGEPLLARAEGSIARTWRRLRRNPKTSASLAAAGVLLFATLTVSAWMLARWSEDRRVAQDVERAATLIQSGDAAARREGMEVLDQTLSRHPECLAAYRVRARARLAEGDWRAARADLDAGIVRAPSSDELRLERARVCSLAGLFGPAKADLDAVVAHSPSLREARVQRAELLREMGDPQKARTDLEAAAPLCRGDLERIEVRSAGLELDAADPKGDAAKAIDALDTLLQEAQKLQGASGPSPELQQLLALLHVRDARARRRVLDDKGALKEYSAALDLLPNSPTAMREKALCYLDRVPASASDANYNTVLYELDRAVTTSPADVRSWWARARAWWPSKNSEGHLKVLDDLLAKFPHWIPALVRRGEFRVDGEDPHAAEADFQEALRLDSSCADASVGLGRVALVEGRKEDAVRRFEEAAKLDPSCHAAAAGLWAALDRAGRTKEADEMWKRAGEMETWPEDIHDAIARARSHVTEWLRSTDAAVYQRTDIAELLDAQALAEQALYADPWCGPALYWREQALLLQGEWKKALEACRTAARGGPRAYYQADLEQARILRDVIDLRDLGASMELIEGLERDAPEREELEYEHALVLEAMARPKEALERLTKALLLDPDAPAPRGARARILYAMGRAEEAKADRAAAEALPRAAPDLDARASFACALASPQGEPEQGELFCDRAIDQAPAFGLAYRWRAYFSEHAGRLAHVGKDATRGAWFDPQLLTELYIEHRAAQANAEGDARWQKRLTRIREWMEREDASDPTVRFGMSFFRGIESEHARALEDVDAALAAHPESMAARAWKGWVLHRLGRDKEAEAILRPLSQEKPRIGLVSYFLACVVAPSAGDDEVLSLLRDAYEFGFDDARVLARDSDLRAFLARPSLRDKLPDWLAPRGR